MKISVISIAFVGLAISTSSAFADSTEEFNPDSQDTWDAFDTMSAGVAVGAEEDKNTVFQSAFVKPKGENEASDPKNQLAIKYRRSKNPETGLYEQIAYIDNNVAQIRTDEWSKNNAISLNLNGAYAKGRYVLNQTSDSEISVDDVGGYKNTRNLSIDSHPSKGQEKYAGSKISIVNSQSAAAEFVRPAYLSNHNTQEEGELTSPFQLVDKNVNNLVNVDLSAGGNEFSYRGTSTNRKISAKVAGAGNKISMNGVFTDVIYQAQANGSAYYKEIEKMASSKENKYSINGSGNSVSLLQTGDSATNSEQVGRNNSANLNIGKISAPKKYGRIFAPAPGISGSQSPNASRLGVYIISPTVPTRPTGGSGGGNYDFNVQQISFREGQGGLMSSNIGLHAPVASGEGNLLDVSHSGDLHDHTIYNVKQRETIIDPQSFCYFSNCGGRRGIYFANAALLSSNGKNNIVQIVQTGNGNSIGVKAFFDSYSPYELTYESHGVNKYKHFSQNGVGNLIHGYSGTNENPANGTLEVVRQNGNNNEAFINNNSSYSSVILTQNGDYNYEEININTPGIYTPGLYRLTQNGNNNSFVAADVSGVSNMNINQSAGSRASITSH